MKLKLIVCGFLLLGSSFGSGAVKNIVVVLDPGEDVAQPQLLGVLSGTTWYQDKAAAKFVRGGERFRFFSPSSTLETATGGKAESVGAPCEETFGISMKPASRRNTSFQIGMTAEWNPRPRAVTVLPNNSAPYQKIASAFLQSRGLKTSSVHLTSIFKVDLDDDKTDEVFIVGRYFQGADPKNYYPSPDGRVGDYSFVLMRKIIGGKVQTISLGDDVLLKATTPDSITRQLASLYDIAGILDLNGDGKLEVVLYNAYYEGSSFEVLEWTGKKFKSRSASGCGA